MIAVSSSAAPWRGWPAAYQAARVARGLSLSDRP